MMLPIAQKLRRLAAAVSLLLLAFTLLPTACAQETTAAIQGTVTDPTGAVVAGAKVTATGDKLIKPEIAITDSHGFYRLNALPPGTYALSVVGSGMKATATDLVLSAGDLPNLNIKLSTAGTEVVIDVSSSVAMVDVTQSKVETTISSEMLQQMPKGRSFQSVIPFAPGARQEPLQSLATLNGATTPNAAGNANIGGNSARANGFQIDGASDAENVYLMDGINITNIQGGGVGNNVPFDFIQELQVKSSSFEAEYGGALGGVINAIEKQGSNTWHGNFNFSYISSALNANDQCAVSTTCGLRLDPTTSANSTTRLDATAQYYNAKQDHYRYVDPSFQIGGPLYKDKLWLFASYAPDFASTRREVISSFTGNAGLHTYYNNSNTQFGMVRLDYAPLQKLRLFANWVNSYSRTVGALPNPDSKTGQLNSSAGTNPTSFRSDTGFVAPGSLYSFGADYMVNSNTVASVRYGYVFYNSETRGVASGLRYLYTGGSATATTATQSGAVIPTAFQQSNGFNNISANLPTANNAYTRKQFSADISNVHSGWYGIHNFKAGYQRTGLGNDVKTLYDYALVNLYYGQAYSVANTTNGCDAIIAANQAKWGVSNSTKGCRGNYGYFTVQDGVDVIGKVSSSENAIYVQDAWTVGRTGLTINAGVRFDKEFLPAYAPGFPTIGFGFPDKIAPRIGGAYDLLHNGKVKVFASYGKFFDTLKYSLPQGSFGGNYWHNCTYTMDDPDYTKIQPTAPIQNGYRHGCPSSGLAPGVNSNAVTNTTPNTVTGDSVGRFVENTDLRATNNSAADPGVDPNVKPMSQHEIVAGGDWAITPTLSFNTRYARKRLDNTVEDMTLNDNFGYYIGNPGTVYGDFLHRAVPNIATSTGDPAYLNPQGICPTCPLQPKASRRYDGIEFRVNKQGHHYTIMGFYTYSRLYGNYPGLTSTYIADGTGGRHNPNNNRSFDLPTMQFTAHGKAYDGPLPTDRPHTLGILGSYQLKTRVGETNLGLQQTIYSGSPISSCFPTTSSLSACQFVEDQGNFVKFTRDSVGNLVNTGIIHNYRTPVYSQTSVNLTHYVPVSKAHESYRIGGEINVTNLLNQHAAMGYNDLPITTSATITTTANPTGIDYHALMTGYDYTAVANGATATSTAPKTLSSQYGLPNTFQGARQIRLKVAFMF